MAVQWRVQDAGGTKYAELAEGVLTVSNGIVSSGTLDVAGDLEITDSDLVLDYPTTGGSLTLRRYDSGVTAVATGGAATTLTLGIPTAAALAGYALKVTTTIAGIDSTTGTLALTGGNTETIGTISAFSAGTKLTKMAPGGVDLTTTNTTQASFTLSGGADNTPSAGAVRLVVWAWVLEALD